MLVLGPALGRAVVAGGRAEQAVERHRRDVEPDQLVDILKARDPARILTAIGNKKDNRWHLKWRLAGSFSTTST